MEKLFDALLRAVAKLTGSMGWDALLYAAAGVMAAVTLIYIVAHFVASNRIVKNLNMGVVPEVPGRTRSGALVLKLVYALVLAVSAVLAGEYFKGDLARFALFMGILVAVAAACNLLHGALHRAAVARSAAAVAAMAQEMEEQEVEEPPAHVPPARPEVKEVPHEIREIFPTTGGYYRGAAGSRPQAPDLSEADPAKILEDIRKLNAEAEQEVKSAPLTDEEVFRRLRKFEDGELGVDEEALYNALRNAEFDFEDMDEDLDEEEEEEFDPSEEEEEPEANEEELIESARPAGEEAESEAPYGEEPAGEEEEIEAPEEEAAEAEAPAEAGQPQTPPAAEEEEAPLEEPEEIRPQAAPAEPPQVPAEPDAPISPAPTDVKPAPAAQETTAPVSPTEPVKPASAAQQPTDVKPAPAAQQPAAPVSPATVMTEMDEMDDEQIMREIERLKDAPEEPAGDVVAETKAAAERAAKSAPRRKAYTSNELIDRAEAAKANRDDSEESMRTMQQVALLLQKEREKKKHKTPEEQRRMNEALADLLRAIGKKKDE